MPEVSFEHGGLGVVQGAVPKILPSKAVSRWRRILRELRKLFARWFPVHEHDWWRGARIADPPTDVYDCRCGARRYVLRGCGIGPDDVYDCVVNRGGSPANALNVVTGLKGKQWAQPGMDGLPPLTIRLQTASELDPYHSK